MAFINSDSEFDAVVGDLQVKREVESDDPAQTPTETPQETPSNVETPGETPAEVPAEVPAETPKAEVPTDTPQETPPAEEPETTPSFNWAELTGYESEEAYKEADLPGKITTLNKQLEEVTSRAEKNPYANDFVKNLNEYVANGGKDIKGFTELSSLDFDQMKLDNPANVIFYNMKSEYPELSDKDIEFKIIQDYKLGDKYSETSISKLREEGEDSLADQYSEERRQAEISLKIDANRASDSLDKYRVDMQTTDQMRSLATDEEFYQGLQDQWIPTMGKITNDFTNFEHSMDGISALKDAGELEAFKYEVSGPDKEKLLDVMPEVMASYELEHTDEHIELARGFLEKEYLYANKTQIINSAIEHGIALARESWNKNIHNPTPTLVDDAPPVEEKKSMAQQIADIEGFKL